MMFLEPVDAVAAECLRRRSFMIVLLDGMADQMPDRGAFVRDFIGRLHRQLDDAEQSSGPESAELLETARLGADALAHILIR